MNEKHDKDVNDRKFVHQCWFENLQSNKTLDRSCDNQGVYDILDARSLYFSFSVFLDVVFYSQVLMKHFMRVRSDNVTNLDRVSD